MSVPCVTSEMPGSWLHSHRQQVSQGMNTVIDNGLQHFPVHAPFKHLIMTTSEKKTASTNNKAGSMPEGSALIQRGLLHDSEREVAKPMETLPGTILRALLS